MLHTSDINKHADTWSSALSLGPPQGMPGGASSGAAVVATVMLCVAAPLLHRECVRAASMAEQTVACLIRLLSGGHYR